MKTEIPVRMKTAIPVTLCSLLEIRRQGWSSALECRVYIFYRFPGLTTPSGVPDVEISLTPIFRGVCSRGVAEFSRKEQKANLEQYLLSPNPYDAAERRSSRRLLNCFPTIPALLRPWLRWERPRNPHLTPRNCGCSPGALVSVSIFKLSMCAMEITVAATYQGSPMNEHTAKRTPTQNKSKW